jgi:hypothetical protein
VPRSAPLERLALPLAVGILAACATSCGGPLTQLELSDAGNRVRVIGPEGIGECEIVGTTTVKVPKKYWIFPRKPMRVDTELEVRARNAAPEIGNANAVAPAGPSINGKRKFLLYRCP